MIILGEQWEMCPSWIADGGKYIRKSFILFLFLFLPYGFV